MIHRLALLVGSLAAAAIVAFAMIRGDRPVSGAPPDGEPGTAAAEIEGQLGPREVVDTVYIAAPRTPRVIRVTRHAKPPREAEPVPARTRTRRHREDDEREGRDREGREREGRDREDD